MSSDQREAAAKNAAIDRQIAQAADEKAKTVKLLLLGWSLFLLCFFKTHDKLLSL